MNEQKHQSLIKRIIVAIIVVGVILAFLLFINEKKLVTNVVNLGTQVGEQGIVVLKNNKIPIYNDDGDIKLNVPEAEQELNEAQEYIQNNSGIEIQQNNITIQKNAEQEQDQQAQDMEDNIKEMDDNTNNQDEQNLEGDNDDQNNSGSPESQTVNKQAKPAFPIIIKQAEKVNL